jgi:PAS domain S-box-containing protein
MEEWVEKTRRDQKVTSCCTATKDSSTAGESQFTEVVVPFLSQGELRGAAVLSWAAVVAPPSDVLLDRLTLLGTFFAGLLDNAQLFEQVFRSRENWLRVIDSIPDSIIVHDDQGRIVRINRALSGRVGAHPSKLIGRPIGDVLPIATNDAPGGCPFCGGTKEGIEGPIDLFSDCSFLVSTTRLAQYSDREAQTIHVLVNVRRQLEAERGLQRERDFNQQILTHTENMILVLDASGQISYVNHRAAEIGYSVDALLGLPLARLIHTSHRPVFHEALRKVLETDAVQALELPILRSDGRVARYAVHLSSMGEEKSGDHSIVVVMTDVTEASQLQAELARSEKMAALGRLVAGVAHEVNNPLSAIVGFTDLLLENREIPYAAREELGLILQEAERTRLIVQNMLRFAREMPPHREPLQVNLVLRQALKLRSYGLASRNVDIVERLSENLPVVVADPSQLEQVFLNILNNAFDALEQTDRRGRIEVETAMRGETVEICFRDNGPGISNPDRIFEPFFTTKPVGQGTGLGLSICYGIIQDHHGEIVCENNASAQGCTFLIRLPAASMHVHGAARNANART